MRKFTAPSRGTLHYHKPEHLKQIMMEKIQSMEPNLTIYTHGSTSEEQENGGAGVTIWDSNDNLLGEISVPAGALCSSYTGECVALLEAINGYAITKFHPTKQY